MGRLEDKICQWLFIDENYGTVFVKTVCDWKTAVMEYVKYICMGASQDFFTRAFSGETIESTIKFLNGLYEYADDKIIAMLPVTEQRYLDESYFE